MRPILTLCLLAVLAAFCTSCSKSTKTLTLSDGTWVGTFQRAKTPNIGSRSNITLTIKGNSYTGTSDQVKYPAICHGTFEIKGTKISFADACVWTAEFDWTLILGGDYKIQYKGDTVSFYRYYNGAYTDIYNLTKK